MRYPSQEENLVEVSSASYLLGFVNEMNSSEQVDKNYKYLISFIQISINDRVNEIAQILIIV
ncbi:MAG: hypothetical protein CMB80_33560 [Flammeovirgaceae bacterium]|nr:hypothetical protein [Flammeovirgaceae bacterium]MBR07607.1 hypothetical protein [Rickettsiales bacterium]